MVKDDGATAQSRDWLVCAGAGSLHPTHNYRIFWQVNSGSVASTHSARRSASGPAVVLAIAAAAFLAQMLTTARYGYFRDELYYLDCARHLAWGYVDQPPLIALIAWVERHLTGDSLYSLRFLPALAGAFTVWLAGRLARFMGAGIFGKAIAALAVLVAPGFLLFFHLLTMNAFEPLFWTGAAYLVVRIVQTENQRLWLWFGVLAGIGILNKWSILFFGAGVFLGLVLTRERRALTQKWIWLGFAIAMVIWLPNVVWNVRHGWPFLELMANVRSSGRDVTHGPAAFLLDQAMFMHFFTAPLWIAGVWWFFFGREHPQEARGRYRVVGWTYLFVLVVFIVAKGKSYYLWPVYPMLFAAGGVVVEQWTANRARVLRPVWLAALILGGALLAPMELPVMSPEGFIRYRQTMHLAPPALEHQRTGPLQQQIYADMFGWDEMVREIGHAYAMLPADIRSKTAIVAQSFGEAGAVDFFGPKYGLPEAISGHQTYWFWGPRNYTGESLLFAGDSAQRVQQLCKNVEVVGHVYHPYSREDEHFDIYWCHPLKWDLQEVWPHAKHFD
jgi:dolichyl-phosphate-mannose-protein mannosyltransferase